MRGISIHEVKIIHVFSDPGLSSYSLSSVKMKDG